MARLFLLALAALIASSAAAAPVRTTDRLSAQANGPALARIALDGRPVAGVEVGVSLRDPRTGGPAGVGFTVAGRWSAAGACLRLEGEVRAAGTEDRAADLIVRVAGVDLPLGSMATDPLLLPAKLLSKLPLVSLRAGGQDALALAVPADRLALFTFRKADGGVELRYPLGFTNDARPELRMRAPFACVLYRTDPRWHFRSALAGYYRLFPEPFRAFAKAQGGWFFAAATKDLPNPQHFAYNESGPAGWQEDEARGLGTYPYRESSSATVSLPGKENPKNYAQAMERLAALEAEVSAADWTPQEACAVDQQVKHSGARSLLADGERTAWAGGKQSVFPPKPTADPIVVKGFSRAAGVAGARDSQYSIYVDVCYADGSYLFGQSATFSPGTHDWEESTYTIKPAKPVTELRVYCLLRGRGGKAWFDDLHVGPAGQPKTNWVKNPGFEAEARRKDLQYIRDNACVNGRGEQVVYITDNLSADVGPAQPMNLLRFTLNLDPDIPSTPERLAVAATEFAYFDKVFADNPGVDGCYIDSVSAWCYGVLNCRRDQWPANTYPFTYEPGSLKVAAAGRFAMVKYLRALQQRYHPKGKAVFTNIHVNLEAFPLYLVSDVPGIESSLFNDEDSVFFYRASSCRKPLLMMDFINLHGLDKRPVAEAFHLNAAQWGAFPSTGRFVERAYREYGDVTHAFLPAIQEISAAGWQPVPLAEGARVERFGERDAVSFTVRAPKEGVLEALRIAPEALAALGTNLVAFDAVWLSPLPLQRDKEGWTLRFTSGAGPLRIVRVMPRSGVPAWLLARAHAHALNATRVQGEHGVAPELRALEAALRPEARGRRQASAGNLQSAIANLQSRRRQAVLKARAAIKNPEGDLFDQSRSREISQAEGALAALAVFLTGADFSIEGSRLAPAGQDVKVAAHAAKGNAGKAFLVSLKPVEGALILPDLDAWQVRTTAGLPEDALSLRGTQPRVVGAVAEFAVAVGSEQPWPVRRCMEVRFAPAVTLQVKPAGATAEGRAYTVSVQRVGPASKVILRPHLAPPAPVEPATAEVEGVDGVTFRVRAVLDGVPRTLAVSATDAAGSELGRAEAPPYWDEAPLPEGNLALARLGVRATTDSSHSDYSPAPLTDGVLDPANLHWTQQAWASADSSQPHWVQIDLARPATVREVRLYWALDNGEVHTSQQYTVVAVTPDGRREVAKVEGQPASTTSRHTFAPVQAKAIRIEQPAGGGPTGRPGIMWVREVCVAP